MKENIVVDQSQKLLFEQMCESVPIECLVSCLAQLCKSFWEILIGFYQVKLWHHNNNICKRKQSNSLVNHESELSNEEYIQEKLSKGEMRIWNDIQAKMCVFISSTKISHLKHESFMQVLSIVQKMKRVGREFSESNSEKMIEAMEKQSVGFFQRYHATCFDELNLFIEHEVWLQVSNVSIYNQLFFVKLFS